MRILYVFLILAGLMLSCGEQSNEGAAFGKVDAVWEGTPLRSTIEYDGFVLTPGEVVTFCAIRIRLTDKEWERFKSFKDRPGTLRAKSYHSWRGESRGPTWRGESRGPKCYRLEDLPGKFGRSDSSGEGVDAGMMVDVTPKSDSNKPWTWTLPENRRLVGYKNWLSFKTRRMLIAGKRYPYVIDCYLDISGKEVCDYALSEKERYRQLGRLPSIDLLEFDYESALKHNFDMVSKISRFGCEDKMLVLYIEFNYFPVDLSHFCFYIGDGNDKIFCNGKRATEKDALEINNYNLSKMLEVVGIEQARKLHFIRKRDADITGGHGILFVMKLCNLDEFLNRNKNILNIYAYNISTHSDVFKKCDVSVDHKVIFYGYDESENKERSASSSVIRNVEELRMFEYGIDTKLDEDVVQSVDFEKNVVLSLRGEGYYDDGYNIKVYDVCAGTPTTAYLVRDGPLVMWSDRWVRPVMLIEVPKGEYQVDFVYWADEFCEY